MLPLTPYTAILRLRRLFSGTQTISLLSIPKTVPVWPRRSWTSSSTPPSSCRVIQPDVP